MAVAVTGSYSSGSTSRLGTSIYRRCSPERERGGGGGGLFEGRRREKRREWEEGGEGGRKALLCERKMQIKTIE